MGLTVIALVTTGAAILLAILLLGALAALARGQPWGAQVADVWLPGAAPSRATAAAFLGAGAASAAFTAAVGIGLLKGSPWARASMLAILALAALNAAVQLARGVWDAFGGLVVPALVAWYLFQPDVKAWFGRAG